MRRAPQFNDPAQQLSNALLVWIDSADTGRALIDYHGGTVWATVPAGLAVTAGDTVAVRSVGQTLAIVQVVAHAPTLT